MDLSERTRLEKLLGMLGSSFDGERANAARMIAAMAERHKVTIAELVFGPSAQSSSGTTCAREPKQQRKRNASKVILEALFAIAQEAEDWEFTLTEWECSFANDVSTRYTYDYELSEKQLLVAQKIIDKVEAARERGSPA